MELWIVKELRLWSFFVSKVDTFIVNEIFPARNILFSKYSESHIGTSTSIYFSTERSVLLRNLTIPSKLVTIRY